MQQLMILLVISSSSTCFGRLYAHRQEVRLRFHCLSVKQPTPHSAHSLPADSPTSQQSQQDRK